MQEGDRAVAPSSVRSRAGLQIAQVPSQPAIELPSLLVEGRAAPPSALVSPPPEPYAGGQVARGARTGALTKRDLRETPLAVQSFTGDFVRDRQLTELSDLSRYDPSLTLDAARLRYVDSLRIRGFHAPYLFDGMAGPFARGIVQQLEPFDGLEVLRGPAATALATLQGLSPGGAINLVLKRATGTPIAQLGFRYFGGQAFGVESTSDAEPVNGAHVLTASCAAVRQPWTGQA